MEEYLVGQKFGRWTIIEKPPKEKYQHYICKCSCGTIRKVLVYSLKNGTSLSCGCLEKENNTKKFKTHGESKTKLYDVWAAMKERCLNKNYFNYKNYGGRGIDVCEEWKDYINFRNWATKNGYENNLTIDRTNNNLGYSPINCKWVTRKEQMYNTRYNRRIYLNGENLTIAEIAKKANKNHNVIAQRINKGYRNDELLKQYLYNNGNKKYIYSFIDKEGNVYDKIENITQFCKEHGIIYQSIATAFIKKRNFYKDWKISRIKINKINEE